ncbi:OmpA family protein [Catalinimonas niigatensis]|uniref:OmpA family protein n=1 Tax=Catalinimonas niigatensis TaxID=1397264 RepID=UPI0026671F0C|nr:OmpA family protein [Catalinimonas niigatensis]WPP49012.1 OmpA family protein [Catalinimonas niigatensis]
MLICFSFEAYSQDNKELARQQVEIGDEIYYEQKAPEVAKEFYILAAQADPDNIKANFMAAKTITETINKGEATPYFLRAYELDPDYRFDLLYSIGRAYQYGLQFEEAIEYYNGYLAKLEKDKEYRGEDKIPNSQVKRRIYECENGIEFVADARNFNITNLGTQINSNSLDYAPVINADETMLIFTSRRKENNLNENVYNDNFPYEDIFMSRKVDGKWLPAENVGIPVNTLYFESSSALSADGQQLYIYRDENNGDLFVSDRKADGSWSPPVPVSANINSSYSENSVSISPDGQTIYFSSNRPGGYGGLDLYKCEKDRRGVWGKVTNLGDKINTPFDEDGVFIDYDSKTLYFSSRGRKGMGGYDIFKSVYEAETTTWNEPVNLGYPINTPDDDIYFVSTKDGKRGYYATVRNGGTGYLDIYMVEIPDMNSDQKQLDKQKINQLAENNQNLTNRNPDKVKAGETKTSETTTSLESASTLQAVQLLLRVEDAATEEAVEATVSMKDMQSGKPVQGQAVAQGIYRFDLLNSKETNYVLAVEKNGYVYKSLKVGIPAATNEAQEFRKKVGLDRASANYKMILNFVYFDFNSARLKEESFDELNRLKHFMVNSPGTRIEIAGHTDNVGPKAYNKQLSLQRAQTIVEFLINEGIDAGRLIAQGYGEEDPLASNDDETEGRALNRRVEMRILEANQASLEE